MVSHDNVIANCALVLDHGQPITVCWLPQHHDMGLIGYYLNTRGRRRRAVRLLALDLHPTAGAVAGHHVALPGHGVLGAELRLRALPAPGPRLGRGAGAAGPQFAAHADGRGRADQAERFPELPQRPSSRMGLKPESFVVAYGLAENTLAVTNKGREALSVNKDAPGPGPGAADRTSGRRLRRPAHPELRVARSPASRWPSSTPTPPAARPTARWERSG